MTNSCTSSRFRRGTAMTETVLVLPIIIFVLSLLMFFGRGMVRVQRVQMLDRYENWRRAAHPYVVDVTEEWQLTHGTWQNSVEQPLGPLHTDNDEQLNETFLYNRAESVSATTGASHGVGSRAASEFIDLISGSVEATDLAERTFAYHPSNRSTTVGVIYPDETVPLWERFETDINHANRTHDHDWRLVNGYRVLVIERSDIESWGYNTATVMDGNRLLLSRLASSNSGVDRLIAADKVVDRGDRFELWRRRWPWAGNWSALRDMYLDDLDDRLRTIDPAAISSQEVYAGALVRWFVDYYHYGGPTVYLR